MSRADAHLRVPRIIRLLVPVLVGTGLLLALPASAAALEFTYPTPVVEDRSVTLTVVDIGAPHYEWDLDDDGAFDDDNGRSATRTFHSARTYAVSVRALDANLAVIDQGRQEIKVNAAPPTTNAPPDASFVFFPAAPVAGLPITLVSTSVDPDTAIPPSAERWDLNGDGLFDEATGPSTTVTFPVPGLYQVSLRSPRAPRTRPRSPSW